MRSEGKKVGETSLNVMTLGGALALGTGLVLQFGWPALGPWRAARNCRAGKIQPAMNRLTGHEAVAG